MFSTVHTRPPCRDYCETYLLVCSWLFADVHRRSPTFADVRRRSPTFAIVRHCSPLFVGIGVKIGVTAVQLGMNTCPYPLVCSVSGGQSTMKQGMSRSSWR